MTIEVEAWIDVVSPWCRISLQQLALAQQEFEHPVTVRYRMWRIDPDAPMRYGMTTIEVLCDKLGITADEADVMLDSVRVEGQEFGLTYNFDIARSGSVFDAHRLIYLAHEFNKQQEMAAKLIEAHFVEGKLLSDRSVLTGIAIDVGLPAEAVSGLLDSEKYADEVLADEALIRTSGAEVRPAFYIDGQQVAEGLVRKADFLKILSANVRI